MKRIVLGLQYDGTPWQGWQTQLHGITVQDRLEAALAEFTREKVGTTCAGRTDTGVHALQQVVHFDTALEREASSWIRGVNAFLPPSIAVRWAREVSGAVNPPQGLPPAEHPSVALPGASNPEQEFHARFSARARTYHYVLYNHAVRSPLLVGKAGWAHRPLDLERMQEAAACLVGTHDFSAFRSSQCQAKTPIKAMYEVQMRRQGDIIIFTLRASAFLHHMVRNLVGSLVYVGSGREPVAWLREVLESRDRSVAAPTFMPDGLYLAKIEYDPKWMLPEAENLLSW